MTKSKKRSRPIVKDGEKTAEALPCTVREAVEFLLARMPEETRTFLCRFSEDAKLQLELARSMVLGMNVRAMLGLWGQNPELLAALPPHAKHPDSASAFLITECWRRLREEKD